MYLPNAVKITVDQGGSYRAPYTWCLANACIAGTVADPDLLKEMTKGHTLRLEFLDSNLLTLTASVPLDRFTAVNADPPTQIFEQDIDE
jgi:invasion protein IalB